MPAPKPVAASDEFDVVDPGQVAPAARPAAAPAAPEPKKYAHSARLVRLAEGVGISAAEIESTPTDLLEREVRYAEQEQRRERQAQGGSRAEAAARQAQAAPVSPPPPPPEPEFLADGQWAKEQLDEPVRDIFRKLEQENREVRKQIGEFTKRDETRQQAAVFDAYDAGFEALGADFAQVFGEGTRHEVTDQGAVQRRIATIQAAGIDPAQDTALAIKRKIVAAAKSLFGFAQTAAPTPADAAAGYGGAAPQTPARRTPPKDPANGQFVKPGDGFEAGQTLRPTNRAGAPLPKGRAAAAAAVEEWQKKNGVAVHRNPDSSEEEESLPD